MWRRLEITERPVQLGVWPGGSKWWRCTANWCIQNNRSIIGVYFSIVCDFCHSSQSHFAPFFFSSFFSDHTTRLFSCLVILYRKQACWTDLTWFVWVRIGRFCIEDFDLVANLCICKCSLFCILQRVSKHCVAMLILLNLHWQAALMVFFYVFVWLFLVSMATDCTWWQATGHYDVNLGLVSLSYFFLLLCTVIWRYSRLSITNL